MTNIPVGITGEYSTRVTADLTINFLGVEDARVLSTPQMIGLMERTCRETVARLLEPGYATIGTHVNVFHLAAATIGSVVTFKDEVTGIDGPRIRFRVEASTKEEKIGEGTHERAIINIAKFAKRQAERRG